MTIKIICVGKVKEEFMREAILHYKKIIQLKNKIEIIEVEDEKTPETQNITQINLVKDKEGNKILSKINKEDFIILLDIQGKQGNTAELLKAIKAQSDKNIVFIIGGSLGVSKTIKNRSNISISISNMTFPHQLMRVILLEQISFL
jgi:23S rRNA (pseudouridine1915-N3)-methyltransferase